MPKTWLRRAPDKKAPSRLHAWGIHNIGCPTCLRLDSANSRILLRIDILFCTCSCCRCKAEPRLSFCAHRVQKCTGPSVPLILERIHYVEGEVCAAPSGLVRCRLPAHHVVCHSHWLYSVSLPCRHALRMPLTFPQVPGFRKRVVAHPRSVGTLDSFAALIFPRAVCMSAGALYVGFSSGLVNVDRHSSRQQMVAMKGMHAVHWLTAAAACSLATLLQGVREVSVAVH